MVRSQVALTSVKRTDVAVNLVTYFPKKRVPLHTPSTATRVYRYGAVSRKTTCGPGVHHETVPLIESLEIRGMRRPRSCGTPPSSTWGGDWDTAGNWVGGAPTASRNAAINLTSSGTVVTVPLLVKSITALLDAVGTTPPTQLPAVSQSPPVGATVVFHMIVDGTVRVSRLSIKGLSLMVRFRSAPRLPRNITVSMNPRRGEWSMGSDPFLRKVGNQVDCGSRRFTDVNATWLRARGAEGRARVQRSFTIGFRGAMRSGSRPASQQPTDQPGVLCTIGERISNADKREGGKSHDENDLSAIETKIVIAYHGSVMLI